MDEHLHLPPPVRQPAAGRTPLRVVVVTETYPPEVNGVAMTLGRMVDGLLRRGHQVQLVRPRQHHDDQPVSDGRLDEVLAPGIPLPRYPGLRLGLPSKRALKRLWRHQRPDVVYVATEGPLGHSALATARQLGLPVTSGFHTQFDTYSRHYGMAWLQRPIATYLQRFHNQTDLTFVPTRQLAQELETSGYNQLQVMARGVDTELFHPQRRSAELRRTWGAGDRDLVVLSVGRMAPEKNLPLVLEAFAAILRRHPRARLVFVGDGPQRSTLQALHPQHHYAGTRHGIDLATHYASGDLFLFPSLTDTFGNVTQEALASGLPVVAYACAAAAELVRPGDNGLLAPAGDASAFVEAAVAAANPNTLRILRNHARMSVVANDWEHIHDHFVSALGQAVRRHYRRLQAKTAIVLTPD